MNTDSIVCYEITTIEQNVIEGSNSMSVQVWADANGYAIQDADDPENYPTLYKAGDSGADVEFSTDGVVPATILSGTHPPHRPK